MCVVCVWCVIDIYLYIYMFYIINILLYTYLYITNINVYTIIINFCYMNITFFIYGHLKAMLTIITV